MNYIPCLSLRKAHLQILFLLRKIVETIFLQLIGNNNTSVTNLRFQLKYLFLLFFKQVAPIMVCMGINVTYHVLHTVMIASAT